MIEMVHHHWYCLRRNGSVLYRIFTNEPMNRA
jgi:hypothetical protein